MFRAFTISLFFLATAWTGAWGEEKNNTISNPIGVHPLVQRIPEPLAGYGGKLGSGVLAKLAYPQDMENLIKAIPVESVRKGFLQELSDVQEGCPKSTFAICLNNEFEERCGFEKSIFDMDKDFYALIQDLKNHKGEKLHLTLLGSSPRNLTAIFESIKQCKVGLMGLKLSPTFTSLLSFNQHTSFKNDILPLLKYMGEGNYLRFLDLSNCHLSHNEIGFMADHLRENTLLKKLVMDLNQIGNEEATLIAQSLHSNRTLTSLNLRFNNIGDKGAIAFAELLESFHSLTALHLASNPIEAKGGQAIGQALGKNKGLKELDLSTNPLKAMGVQAIAKGLEENQTLESLNLNYIYFGNEGAYAIAKVLKINQTLHTLLINGNNIADMGALSIMDALGQNETLRTLYMQLNPISSIVKRSLLKLAKSKGIEIFLDDDPWIGSVP